MSLSVKLLHQATMKTPYCQCTAVNLTDDMSSIQIASLGSDLCQCAGSCLSSWFPAGGKVRAKFGFCGKKQGPTSSFTKSGTFTTHRYHVVHHTGLVSGLIEGRRSWRQSWLHAAYKTPPAHWKHLRGRPVLELQERHVGP